MTASSAARAYLDDAHHYCDICKQPFGRLKDLANHDCTPRAARGNRVIRGPDDHLERGGRH